MWSEVTLTEARRARPRGRFVSFGWREYVGDRDDVALGEEGLDLAVTEASYRLASDLAQRWFVAGGRKFLEWEGVPVGAAAQADLFAFFEPHVRSSFVLEHILATRAPAKVAFVDDGSLRPRFLAAALEGRGVPYEALGGRPRRGGGLRAALRRRAWPAMFLAARWKARREAGEPRLDGRMRGSGDVVFWGQLGRFELDVYERFRRAFGEEVPFLAATLAATREAGRAGLTCDSLLDRLPPRGRTRRLFRALASQYRDLERAGAFEAFDLPPGLVPFFRAHLPFRPEAYLITLAMFAAAVEAFFARWRPSLLVHLSDVHMTGRLVASFASRRGVPTLVIQNHITGGPTFGYLPLSSTKMAVWGPVSRDWMIAGGAPPDKLAVVGSPYAALAVRKSAAAATEPARGEALVVATNNADPDQNRLLAQACAWCARERGRPLLFRPHPTEPEALYEAIIRKRLPGRGKVVREAPLAEVLRQAAVVVTGHSGVGVDAVVARVPLVHVNLMAGVPDYIPYVEYGAALGVGDIGALPDAIEEAAEAPPGRFDAGREAFGRAYLGADAGDPFDNLAALARELEGRR